MPTTAPVRRAGADSQRHSVVDGVPTSSRDPMLTVLFIITMAAVGIVFVMVNRWQAVSGDRQKLADRSRTLDVLGKIVAQHADTPVDTDKGWQNRPTEVQRRVARPLPVAFNVLGVSGITVVPPVSPRSANARSSGNGNANLRYSFATDNEATTVTPAESLKPPRLPAAATQRPSHHHDGVVHRRLLRLSSDDLPPDPDGPQRHATEGPSYDMLTLDTNDSGTPLTGVGAHHGDTSTSSQRHHRRHRRRRLATVAGGVALVAAVSMASNWNANDPTGSPATATDASSQGSPLAIAPPPEPTAPSVPLTPGLVVGDVAAFEVAAPFTLDLAADQPSWVQVRTRSGQVLFEQTLQPGESTQVNVDQPIAVRTGNPAGLAVTAGFVPLDHPRPAGQPITLHLG